MVLALDIGGTKIMAALVDKKGAVTNLYKEGSKTKYGKEVFIEQLYNIIDTHFLEHIGRISAIGASLPGITDSEIGILKYAPFSGIENIDVRSILKEKYNLPVYVENDVNACAVAEKYFGGAKDCENFVWITISTGIGGAVFANGRIISGYDKMAGEFGHLIVKDGGELCGCGRRGCLEAEAAGPAWVRKLKKAIENGCNTILKDKCLEEVTAKDIVNAAREKDALSEQIIKDAAVKIGKSISWIINILNPEKVFLGGGVMEAEDLLLETVKETAAKHVISDRIRQTPILKTNLGYNAGLMGAAVLALYRER